VGNIFKPIKYCEENVKDCVIRIDEVRIAMAINKGLIEIWDIEEGVCLKTLRGQDRPDIHITKINHFNNQAGNDNIIRIWDLF